MVIVVDHEMIRAQGPGLLDDFFAKNKFTDDGLTLSRRTVQEVSHYFVLSTRTVRTILMLSSK